MQPSSSSSSWMPSNNSNTTTSNSNFWSNGGFRKRKAAASDLDEKTNQKMFVTEEKMLKEMQTLSLDLASLNNNNNNIPNTTPQIIPEPIDEEIKSNDEDSSDEEQEKNTQETRVELHKLLKDSLKNDDLQDSLISKLCEIERRKFTMQLVPYMPIHPAQLSNDTATKQDEDEEEEEERIIENPSPVIFEELKNDDGDHLFKMPSLPTLYTVEEPSDNITKRACAMKRSYSQSNQCNGSLSVTELKHNTNDQSSIHPSQSGYFVVEPTATPLNQTLSNTSSSSLSSSGPSIRITEFLDNPSTNNEFTNTLDDDDIDMQSVASSDTGDKMDDD
ncbi:unnamed protein product [Adineta steineri]|uniref:Uncharacterized protein n=1 Tax=Adineta steineri TaxID=433720 RepID=A0A819AF10_9BILA|nr:unnamed protein product [Adineta steineri]